MMFLNGNFIFIFENNLGEFLMEIVYKDYNCKVVCLWGYFKMYKEGKLYVYVCVF